MEKKAVDKPDHERGAITMETLRAFLARKRRSTGDEPVVTIRVPINEDDRKKLVILAKALSGEKRVTPNMVASALLHLALEKIATDKAAASSVIKTPRPRNPRRERS
jgi:hypothetical protein